MTSKNKTPTTGQPVAGASKFQQSKRILTLALHRLNAIFCMRVFSLGDVLPLFLSVLGLIVLEVLK